MKTFVYGQDRASLNRLFDSFIAFSIPDVCIMDSEGTNLFKEYLELFPLLLKPV